MEWLSLDMLAHVYYIVVKTYSLQTKGYIHSIYHSGLFYRKSFTHSFFYELLVEIVNKLNIEEATGDEIDFNLSESECPF